MKLHRSYLALFALTGTGCQAQNDIAKYAQTQITNCHAIDGDTLNCQGKRYRLLAIDTAEMLGHCTQGRVCAKGDPYRQKAALQATITQSMTAYEITQDRYQRAVVFVINARGENLSCSMLAAEAEYRPQYDNDNLIASSCPQLI
ncbi:MAG: thermonuclease family protein [Sphingomonadales bacterium]|nr:thermonuclease family protein [Sphingomonadales bacterium]